MAFKQDLETVNDSSPYLNHLLFIHTMNVK